MPDLDTDEDNRLWERYRIRTLSYETKSDGRDHSALLSLLDSLASRSGLGASNDTATTTLAIARYGNRLSKLNPGPGISLTAQIFDWETPIIEKIGLRFQNGTIDSILLGLHTSFILQGPAGSGKSFSIRQYLAYCGEVLQDWALTEKSREQQLPAFPILLDARLYAGDFTALASTSLPVGLSANELVDKVRPVVVVDSLDEMPSEYLDKGTWEADLKAVTDMYGGCQVIFGTRRADLVPTKGLPVFHVAPLRKEIIEQTLSSAGVTLNNIRVDLRQILASPFTLLLASRFLRRHRAGQSANALLKAFLRSAIDELGIQVKGNDLVKALQKIAWTTMSGGRDTIFIADVESALESVIKANRSPSGRVVDRLVSRGLMVSELDERVRFAHRIILEYLAAGEIASRFVNKSLALSELLSFRRWDNALAFSASLLPPEQLARLISQICTYDPLLALRVSDFAEIKREYLLNHVLREIAARPSRFEETAHSISFNLSRIKFPPTAKRSLVTLTKRGGPLFGAASAALVPLMTDTEICHLIAQGCEGKVKYNDTNYLGEPIGSKINNATLEFVFDSMKKITRSGFDNPAIQHFIETIIVGMTSKRRSLVRSWASSQSKGIRRAVADALDTSSEREDIQFVAEQWTSGLRLSFSLYRVLKYHADPTDYDVFSPNESRLARLRHFLLEEGTENRRWTLDLLVTVADSSDKWKAAIEGAARTEINSFVRKAMSIVVSKDRESVVSDVFRELQSGVRSDEAILLSKIFNNDDWASHVVDAIDLLQSDDSKIVVEVADALIPPRTAMARPLTGNEIDRLLERLLFWNEKPFSQDTWFAVNRITIALSKLIDNSGSQHLLLRANDPKDPHRRMILADILPSISGALVTTNELTAESCRLMLDEYISRPGNERLESSPGRIATEKFIEEYVLPLTAIVRGEKKSKRLQKILVDAGNRHGRRYQISGATVEGTPGGQR